MGGHDFFMVVNRHKIAKNKSSIVRIEIDGSKGKWITNLSENRVHELPNEWPGNDWILKQEFAPGQGKLFAIGTNPKIPPRSPALEVEWIPLGKAFPGEPILDTICMYHAKMEWTFDRGNWLL